MLRTRFFQIIPLLFLLTFGCRETPAEKIPEQSSRIEASTSGIISPDDSLIQYTGRIDFSNPKSPKMFWAGTSIKAKFEGTSISIKLDDGSGKNYYNAIIDGNIEERIVIDCRTNKSTYLISDSLEAGEHIIEIVRRTDPRNTSTHFNGFELESGKKLKPLPEKPKLKIEFFGNSITSAHGVLDESRNDNDNLLTWDNTMSYAAMTARRIDAEYHSTSMSGIGVVKSWYPLIMPQMYNRLAPNKDDSKWDFSQWTPDIVVVNLFQNDSWLIKNHKAENMIEAYVNFIQTIRKHYPEAYIICALGNMDITRKDSPWPNYVKTAVNNLSKAPSNDKKLHSLIFPYKETGGHPTVKEHEVMTDQLVEYLEKYVLNEI